MHARPSFPCLFALALLSSACASEPTPEVVDAAPTVVEVRTLEVTPHDWSETILAYGVVESIEEVSLSASLGATVLEVHFDVGDLVEVGALLVEFDPASRNTQLKQSRADLNAAKAAVEDARVDFEEAQRLERSGAMARVDVDATQRTLRRAKESYENARSGYSMARTDVNDTMVESPVSGRVSERFIDPGETISVGASIATLVVTDALRVTAYVSERRVNQVRAGARATVEVSGVPGKSYAGRVEHTSLAADADTGNFEVQIAISEIDPLLRPGMTARVYLDTLPESDVIAVPVAAMVERDRTRVLFVERDGKARRIEPVVGLGTEQLIPIYEGLAAGDRVIVEGLDFILDGTAVSGTPVPPDPSLMATTDERATPANEADTKEEVAL